MNVEMKVGDVVKIEKCDKCSAVIGKTAKIKAFASEPEHNMVELNFGKGRPQVNRPHLFNLDDISLVKE
jgi:hypothetical protein